MAGRVTRRALALSTGALAAAALLTGLMQPASAAGATSYTQVVHGTDQLDPEFGPNPCTGDPLTGTQRENVVQHLTVRGDEVWSTFTEEAWVDLIDSAPDGSQVAYTGHYVAWGDFNLNQRNQTSTFTFNVQLSGADGTALTGHEVTQFVLLPDGSVAVSFDKTSLTCGSDAS